jgi:hypothetical protein
VESVDLVAKNTPDCLINMIGTEMLILKKNVPLSWLPKMLKEKFKLYTVERHHGERVSVLGTDSLTYSSK